MTIYIYTYISWRTTNTDFLILSRHSSLSSIALGMSSMLHSILVQSCCRLVSCKSNIPLLVCVSGVHRSTAPVSSSLLLQQWLGCLARLILDGFSRWMVSVSTSSCFCGMLVQYSSQHSCCYCRQNFLSISLVSIHVVSSIRQYWPRPLLGKKKKRAFIFIW